MAEQLEEARENHEDELLDNRDMSEGYYKEWLKQEKDELIGDINPEDFEDHAEKAVDPEESLEENIINMMDYIQKNFHFKGERRMEKEEEEYQIEENIKEKKMDCNIGAALLSGMAKAAGVPNQIKRIKGKNHPKVVMKLKEKAQNPEIDFYRGRYHVKTENGIWQVHLSNHISFFDRFGRKKSNPNPKELTELEKIIDDKAREFNSS